jgi:hypothetical protein
MVKPAPKAFLWTDGTRWYVRRRGVYTRINAEHGTPEFDRLYWDIRSGKAAATSWAKLIDSYRASEHWRGLASRTRFDYEKVLDYIKAKNGTHDVTKARRPDVLAAMDANRHRTRFANTIPVVMSQLFQQAIDLGWRDDNPAKGTRQRKVPVERRQPHLPWTDAAVEKWRAEATALPRLIFELGVGTVQRPDDWTRFTWEDFDGKSLHLVQGKTGVALQLPCTPALLAALQMAGGGTGAILCKARTPGAMSYRYMAQVMLGERKRLGLEAYDLHALRYRGVMELAWAGCTDEEIASYSGHASLTMIRKYAGKARQIMRARQAAAKRG